MPLWLIVTLIALLGWPLLALGAGLLVGRAIRLADEREFGPPQVGVTYGPRRARNPRRWS